jgi:hypothetical protein
MEVSILVKSITFDMESDDDDSMTIDESKELSNEWINKIYKIEVEFPLTNEDIEERILEHITNLSGWLISEMVYDIIEEKLKEILFISQKSNKSQSFTGFYKKLLDDQRKNNLLERIKPPSSKYKKDKNALPSAIDIIKIICIDYIASNLCSDGRAISILKEIEKSSNQNIDEVIYDALGEFDYYYNDENTDEKDSMRDQILQILGYEV